MSETPPFDIIVRDDLPPDRIFLVSPRRVSLVEDAHGVVHEHHEPLDEWARRCGRIDL